SGNHPRVGRALEAAARGFEIAGRETGHEGLRATVWRVGKPAQHSTQLRWCEIQTSPEAGHEGPKRGDVHGSSSEETDRCEPSSGRPYGVIASSRSVLQKK